MILLIQLVDADSLINYSLTISLKVKDTGGEQL